MTTNSIKLVNLTKKYGSFTAVDNLNLEISKGQIFGLLGPNGAGKSTTILMMLGLTEPTAGTVSVCGIDPAYYPIRVKRKIGYLPEDIGFYDDLTGLENLMYIARLNGIPDKVSGSKAMELLNWIGLSDVVNKKTGKYSRGMRQRLGLAEVLIKDPEVIILDEPTLGIDPKGVREFLELIVELSRKHSITVLFSSHHLHQVQQVCDRVGLFVSGKLLADGDIPTLSKQLFSNSIPYIIEVGIGHDNYSTDQLSEVLKGIVGIIGINMKNNVFEIACSGDVSAEIARAVVLSGAGLRHLCRKEYGLDDIYNRYFEGGEDHE